MIRKRILMTAVSIFMLGVGAAQIYATAIPDESFLGDVWGASCGRYPCLTLWACGGWSEENTCKVEGLEITGKCGRYCDTADAHRVCEGNGAPYCQYEWQYVCSPIMQRRCEWSPTGPKCVDPQATGDWCPRQVCW